MSPNTRGRPAGETAGSAGFVKADCNSETDTTNTADVQSGATQVAARDLDTRTVRVTFFKDQAAQSQRTASLTLPQLCEKIIAETAASKMDLPWLKLATFGNRRSDKNCLRTNENVKEITGIETDYDAGLIPFDDAIAVMRKSKVRCLLYTSASHVAGVKERWRILVPLSIHYPPEMREKLVARINGLFDGKLAGESFTLSQAYLFGSVDNPDHRAIVLDGDFLDLRDDLYAGSIFKDGSRVGDRQEPQKSVDNIHGIPRDHDPEPIDRAKIVAALAVIDSNCSYEVWRNVGGALHFELGESGFEIFDAWSATSPQYDADECKEKWRGVRSMNKITAGTIFHLADAADHGWRDRFDEEARNKVYSDLAEAYRDVAKQSPIVPPPPPPKPSTGLPLTFFDDFNVVTPKQWILKGVIAKDETSSFIGPPGAGKSALVTDIVFHVASGMDWRGYRLKQKCGVVYFALERAALVKRRLTALGKRTGQIGLPIAVAAQGIDLLKKSCVDLIVATIRNAEAKCGIAVEMIVIDTFAKGIAAGGGEENSARDQNMVAANLRRVQELTGVHVTLVGHTGKDETRGARGSNARVGDDDLMVQVEVDEESKRRTAKIIINKDGEQGVLTSYQLEVVTLGQDDDGDDITTAILNDKMPDADKETSRAKLSKTNRRAMELLERALENGKQGPTGGQWPKGIGRVVTVEEWRGVCAKGGLSAGNPDSAERVFRRAMSDLIAAHRIGTWDGLVWIAYE